LLGPKVWDPFVVVQLRAVEKNRVLVSPFLRPQNTHLGKYHRSAPSCSSGFFCSVADTNLDLSDPYDSGPPGSGSGFGFISQRFKSGSKLVFCYYLECQ
jgi:hypothetical protein